MTNIENIILLILIIFQPFLALLTALRGYYDGFIGDSLIVTKESFKMPIALHLHVWSDTEEKLNHAGRVILLILMSLVCLPEIILLYTTLIILSFLTFFAKIYSWVFRKREKVN